MRPSYILKNSVSAIVKSKCLLTKVTPGDPWGTKDDIKAFYVDSGIQDCKMITESDSLLTFFISELKWACQHHNVDPRIPLAQTVGETFCQISYAKAGTSSDNGAQGLFVFLDGHPKTPVKDSLGLYSANSEVITGSNSEIDTKPSSKNENFIFKRSNKGVLRSKSIKDMYRSVYNIEWPTGIGIINTETCGTDKKKPYDGFFYIGTTDFEKRKVLAV